MYAQTVASQQHRAVYKAGGTRKSGTKVRAHPSRRNSTQSPFASRGSGGRRAAAGDGWRAHFILMTPPQSVCPRRALTRRCAVAGDGR